MLSLDWHVWTALRGVIHHVWNVLVLLVVDTGLPPTGSWQDLKDHMREAGDICYADVFHDGTGVVEFVRYEDMKYAVKKLDDTKFKSHEVGVHISCQLAALSFKAIGTKVFGKL